MCNKIESVSPEEKGALKGGRVIGQGVWGDEECMFGAEVPKRNTKKLIV